MTPGGSLLLRDVEIEGVRSDVRVRRGVVAEIGPLAPASGDDVLDCAGGALLPGLHDHHLHLLAAAAAQESVACGPMDTPDAAALRLALCAAGSTGRWVRGVGYHESVAGPLDRRVLDSMCPDRPVRIQHRTGALWMLNSAALLLTGISDDTSPDVGRDQHGEPDGRLWRYDQRLRERLPEVAMPDLGPLGSQLAHYGVTGVTDATPDLDATALDHLSAAVIGGTLPVRLMVLGHPDPPSPLTAGPAKIHLRDHDLPSADALTSTIVKYRERDRPVALHCVSMESLALAVTALRAAGAGTRDRIEHAAVVPPPLRSDLRALGVTVVTQPGLVFTRGSDYLREIEEPERSWLYPYASLREAGIAVAGSSDHPYGPLDPWLAVRAATSRRTSSLESLGADECVSATVALGGYLTAPSSPGGPPRRVQVGAPADLCVLDESLRQVLADPAAERVAATIVSGAITYQRR